MVIITRFLRYCVIQPMSCNVILINTYRHTLPELPFDPGPVWKVSGRMNQSVSFAATVKCMLVQKGQHIKIFISKLKT